MTSITDRVLLLGLPATGKSTFLAALWHIVQTRQLPGSLEIDRLDGDREYIEMLRTNWLACKAVPRTRRGSYQRVTVRLKRRGLGDVTTLVFPDLAGELFNTQWEERRWEPDYADLTGGMSGLLVFLNAKDKHMPALIADFQDTLRQFDDDDEDQEEYDPSKAAPQVKIVDLLQFHAVHARLPRPARVAVIISAWDVVEATPSWEDLTPEEFLANHVPLLDQYLRANPETYVYRVYGVSAQGGDVERDRERLQAAMVEAERIRVVHAGKQSHDITEPLKWLVYGSN